MDLLNCNRLLKKKFLLDSMIMTMKLIALRWDTLNRLTIALFSNSLFVSNSHNNRILQYIRMCLWRWSRTKRAILELRVSNLSFQERKRNQLIVNSQRIIIIIAMKVLLLMEVIIRDSNSSKYLISVDWMIISRIQGIIILISVWISVLTCDSWRMDKYNNKNRNNSRFNREKEGYRHNTNNNKRQQQ